MEQFDLLVIGFGKAGKTLAGKLAAAGKKVALVEENLTMFGGTCINIGCIPTKTLKASAEALETALRLAEFGITCEGTPCVDPAAVLARKEKELRDAEWQQRLGRAGIPERFMVSSFGSYVVEHELQQQALAD